MFLAAAAACCVAFSCLQSSIYFVGPPSRPSPFLLFFLPPSLADGVLFRAPLLVLARMPAVLVRPQLSVQSPIPLLFLTRNRWRRAGGTRPPSPSSSRAPRRVPFPLLSSTSPSPSTLPHLLETSNTSAATQITPTMVVYYCCPSPSPLSSHPPPPLIQPHNDGEARARAHDIPIPKTPGIVHETTSRCCCMLFTCTWRPPRGRATAGCPAPRRAPSTPCRPPPRWPCSA